MRVVKHVALDEEFCRLYPQLYYNKSKQVNWIEIQNTDSNKFIPYSLDGEY